MHIKKILSPLTAALFATVFTFNTVFASSGQILRVSVIDVGTNQAVAEADFEDPGSIEIVKEGRTISRVNVKKEVEICGFEAPEESKYDASVVEVRRVLRVEPGEEFRVKVFLKNKGNMPWFKKGSSCLGPKMSLGTDKERDHDGLFYAEGLMGWEASNRIYMDQMRVDPGEIASFTFFGKAGDEADVMKEYFTPVLEGISWLDKASFGFEVMIGETGESMKKVHQKVRFSLGSGSVMNLNLDGEKALLVDRTSAQKLYLLIDNKVVAEFPVSTGAPATPTPVGTTEIKLKQEVRVGSKSPYYIMPKFMWFREGGYGFHALPSLGGDGGIFWTEALDHIGRPVSHGCIRLLPDDADFVYDFAEIGTKVMVRHGVIIDDGYFNE
ncbi:L,D-transpeptidase [Candidatus Peregrinibacteria bacterium]|nr:L,D-transpeptidase [Candidatus Peregrinibacteria bacterium]